MKNKDPSLRIVRETSRRSGRTNLEGNVNNAMRPYASSIRCLAGLHQWNYFAVKTNLGSGNVVRICVRCKDLQNWMGSIGNWRGRWSFTLDPSDSIAQEILRRAEVTPPFAPVDYTEDKANGKKIDKS